MNDIERLAMEVRVFQRRSPTHYGNKLELLVAELLAEHRNGMFASLNHRLDSERLTWRGLLRRIRQINAQVTR